MPLIYLAAEGRSDGRAGLALTCADLGSTADGAPSTRP
jgi:hypothetical protein